MFEDVSTSQVLWMYLGWFTFIFSFVVILFKKNSKK